MARIHPLQDGDGDGHDAYHAPAVQETDGIGEGWDGGERGGERWEGEGG